MDAGESGDAALLETQKNNTDYP